MTIVTKTVDGWMGDGRDESSWRLGGVHSPTDIGVTRNGYANELRELVTRVSYTS